MRDTVHDTVTTSRSPFSTEFAFTLPKGYIDHDGKVHREGVMRLATARDEIEPLGDPRVKDNKAYLVILILSRVVTKLGDLNGITSEIVEQMYSADLSFLQDLYRSINEDGEPTVSVTCPSCSHAFDVEYKRLGK
jgi:hypothetical protein